MVEKCKTIKDVQRNLETAIAQRKEDQSNLESKLELKIKGLENKIDTVSKDVCGVKEDVRGISDTLKTWQPYMESYEKELDRSKAYQLVANDLKSKGVSGRFWLTLVSVFIGLIATILVILERLHILK